MKTKTLGFIGGGRITGILLRAFQKAGISFNKITVYDVNETVLLHMKNTFSYASVTGNINDVVDSSLIVLAVHPPVALETLDKIKGKLKPDSAVLSLVPKITIEKSMLALNGFKNVARMNPSASSIVNKGVNPVAFSDMFDKSIKESLLEVFQPLGYMPVVSDEKIEAYAVISAMGHTYFNFQLQKLKELAIQFGMTEDEASRAITNMLWGTTETLFNSGLNYSQVDDLVPVKPMAEVEKIISEYYEKYLNAIYNKIKP